MKRELLKRFWLDIWMQMLSRKTLSHMKTKYIPMRNIRIWKKLFLSNWKNIFVEVLLYRVSMYTIMTDRL